jgi:hypothetical protein
MQVLQLVRTLLHNKKNLKKFKKVHLGLIFHLNLQYPNLYLPLPIGILGFRCNTYTRTYFY